MHDTREAWLLAARVSLEARVFCPAGYEIPATRIGVGWPIGNKKRIQGQCHSNKNSADKTYEIFISPKLDDIQTVLAVLAHELAHAVVGTEAAHKKPFIDVARAIGLVGPKWTMTTAGEYLADTLKNISVGLGNYPHAILNLGEKEKKQSTRLLKVACPECGYVVRVTRKWLDEAGAPLCPVHKIAFQEEVPEGK